MLPLVAAGALYALLCTVLSGSLPEFVPISWDSSLVADRFVRRHELVLLSAAVGLAVAAVSGGGAALVRWYAPAGTTRQAQLRQLVSADLVHLGSVTLLFLTLELAVGYGPEGVVGASGADSYASAEAELAAAAGTELPVAALVLLAGYALYLLGWAGWWAPRRYRPHPAPREADSTG